MKLMWKISINAIPPSLNQFYGGRHWSWRKEVVDTWHGLFRAAFLEANLPKELPTPILLNVTQFCKNKPRDADNVVISGKFCGDSLKLYGYVPDDSPKHIKTVDIRPQELPYTIDIGAGGAITSDNQTVGADTTVFFRYHPDRLVEMWSQYGESRIQNLLTSSVKESFKETLGDYTIFNVAVSQEEIRSKVAAMVKEKMASYPLDVTELRITNYDWSDAFDAQIATTMEKAQQVKQAEQELLITEQQAQKQVKQAEAAKQATIAEAEGEKAAAALRAEAKALEGEGIKKFNDSIASNLNIEVRLRELEIERIRVEKWNGQYVANNNYLPIPFTQGTTQGR